ncbi:MAG: hypothetical protein ACJAT4_002688 [Granulosicoccus sp.]|jgi:hypothetical protein
MKYAIFESIFLKIARQETRFITILKDAERFQKASFGYGTTTITLL